MDCSVSAGCPMFGSTDVRVKHMQWYRIAFVVTSSKCLCVMMIMVVVSFVVCCSHGRCVPRRRVDLRLDAAWRVGDIVSPRITTALAIL